MSTSRIEDEVARRSRAKLFLLLIFVVLAGLGSRQFPVLFPAVFGTSLGDALWALMVFLGWAIVFPSSSTLRLATIALISAYCVEFSQLYQEPWINGVRGTVIGHLVLGSTFWWPDLVAYLIGVVAGTFLDKLLFLGATGISR